IPPPVCQRGRLNRVLVVVQDDLRPITFVQLLQIDTDEVSSVALAPADAPLVLVGHGASLGMNLDVGLTLESCQHGIPDKHLGCVVRNASHPSVLSCHHASAWPVE